VKAVGIHTFGGSEVMEVMDVPEPKVAPDGVLIRGVAAGINPVDWKVREGRLQGGFPHAFPVVLGWDVSGRVERVGAGVHSVNVGDAVMAYCRKHFIGEGTYAELVSVPEEFVVPAPNGSGGLATAAALPLTGLTAYQALVEVLAVADNDTVLIVGAGGGVGTFAIQIAAGRGARVIASASPEKHPYLESLGAAQTVGHITADSVREVTEQLGARPTVVLDVIGGSTLEAALELMAPGGRAVSIVDTGVSEKAAAVAAQGTYVFGRPNRAILRELGQMVDDGSLRIEVSATYALEDAAAAHRAIEEGHTKGKIVLDLTGDQ
jgi:NADPH:quinone reductase-like Zn-dependent oxidoreductase